MNYLRVWGCRYVVRLPDPKMKILNEKGIECIFFGYAKHSMAFIFYFIESNESVSINSIIESKDAIFVENRFSSVPRPSLRISNRTEDISGLVVCEEVTEEMDMKTSFLNGELVEEVYMNQSRGFIILGNGNKAVSQLKYSRVSDCLMYAMTCTRPDSSFSVGKLSSNTIDISSTNGWVFLLGGGAISWAFKKKTCIIGSIMEFEFVALAAASKEAK
nr:zinc finger, CCHC-type [Tanacetum cinerariifolium]